MTHLTPDPLLRFVPAPHTCTLPHPHGETRVESNAPTFIAALLSNTTPVHAVQHLRIIIDDSVSEDGDHLTLIHSAHLRTLLRGTVTILIFDSESRELLAFLSPEVSPAEFLDRLIPALLPPNRGNGITNA